VIIDLILAVLHHVFAFGLFALYAVEKSLIRSPLDARLMERIARLDAIYGAAAGGVVVIGILRVFFGLKGYQYYVGNVWFWAKMASFVVVALLSIRPTRAFGAWRRAARANPAFTPDPAEVEGVKTFLNAEGVLLLLVLVFAATMARYG
jgi:putative membrane protein